MNFEGKDKKKLFVIKDAIDELNANKDWIYYIDDDTLKKIKTDGTKDTILYKYQNIIYDDSLKIRNISVCGSWIYFEVSNPKMAQELGQSAMYETCRMKIDGSNFENL
jgi:hypothetical protein